jgi:RimJ/RimL family protein N-acetyltransferase
MTSLHEVWPLFGLRLHTPRLFLRPVLDEDLPGLVDAALAGIHPPEVMPFSVPWTDAPRDELVRELLKYQWRLRTSVSPDSWKLAFAVLHDGVVLGTQDLSSEKFAATRTVSTGSWLAQPHQGKGFGSEMRAAVLAFAFDHLGAEVAESGAATWNEASKTVSRRLGYRENGITRQTTRPGFADEVLGFRLLREEFVRPAWTLEVEGREPALTALLG